jgi:hypothetical protein
MKTVVSKVAEQPQNAPAAEGEGRPLDTSALLREALAAYWETDGQDESLRGRIMALPNGAAALAKGEQIREAFQPFAGTGISVEQFLREKHSEARRESVRPDR